MGVARPYTGSTSLSPVSARPACTPPGGSGGGAARGTDPHTAPARASPRKDMIIRTAHRRPFEYRLGPRGIRTEYVPCGM